MNTTRPPIAGAAALRCRTDSITSAPPSLNGKIYTVGGFVASVHKDGQPDVFEYDPAADSWRSLSPLKSGLGSVGVTVLDGKIHAIGGRNPAGQTVATHQVYDPATNSWSERAPLPRARDHMAVVAAEGKIHAVGGRFGASNEPTDMHDIYDPATNSWTSGPPLPTARSGLAYTLYQGLILVLGGELAPNTFAQNEAYDPKTKSWRTLAANACGPAWNRRCNYRRTCLHRRRIIEAWSRADHRPVDCFHFTLTGAHVIGDFRDNKEAQPAFLSWARSPGKPYADFIAPPLQDFSLAQKTNRPFLRLAHGGRRQRFARDRRGTS